jgi:electron transfer flavoprotein beta subunit
MDGTDAIVVKRQFEDRYHVIRAPLPCLLTALSGMNIPRYMTPGGVFSAFREKTVEVWALSDITVDTDNIGLKGSPTRVVKSFTRQARGTGEIIRKEPEEAARFIFDTLHTRHII